MPLNERDRSIVKAVAKSARQKYEELKAGFEKRLQDIEQRLLSLSERPAAPVPGEKGDKGDPGESVRLDDVLPALEKSLAQKVAEWLQDLPQPKDGKDGASVSLDDIQPLVATKQAEWALDFERRAQDLLQRAIERFNPPADGKDGRDGVDGKDADPDDIAARVIDKLNLKGTSEADIRTLCKELVAAEVEAFPRPKDGVDGKDGEPGTHGKDAEPVSDEQILAAVAKYLQDNPPPAGQDGKDGTDGQDGRDGVDGQDGADGRDGAPGRDGTDGKSVGIEEIKQLMESHVSAWALDFEKRAQDRLQKAIDAIPKPKDGVDGINFEDFDAVMDPDGRTLKLSLANGDRVVEKSIRLAVVLDRGVFKEGDDYVKGDGVTWGGSFWIAQKDAPKGKPGQFNRDWRLAVKRGQAGKS